jgi:CheY-like chemotaxis protein
MNRPLCIVVINPSPTVCQLLKDALHRRGHHVHCFLDPVLALHTLLQTRTVPLPDILFLNITSTFQLTAYEVLRRFRTESPQVPIVVICPPADALIQLKAYLAGASTFLGEPVQIQQVVALVQRLAMRPYTSTK